MLPSSSLEDEICIQNDYVLDENSELLMHLLCSLILYYIMKLVLLQQIHIILFEMRQKKNYKNDFFSFSPLQGIFSLLSHYNILISEAGVQYRFRLLDFQLIKMAFGGSTIVFYRYESSNQSYYLSIVAFHNKLKMTIADKFYEPLVQ